MSKILGISGKKQAGKNSAANFIFGSILVDIGVLLSRDITNKGELVGSMVTQNEKGETATFSGIIDAMSRDPITIDLYERYVWPFVKMYSFADPLKEFCIEVLGLDEKQCYGTNEQKDSPTHLLWENMPNTRQETGQMTGREVLQYFGTNICRQMYDNVWVDATIRKIQKEKPGLAIIPDVRFPNEVEGIQQAGGRVIRLLRAPFAGQDQHESETALDNYPLEKFDAVIDNKKMNIPQQNKRTVEILLSWGWDSFED